MSERIRQITKLFKFTAVKIMSDKYINFTKVKTKSVKIVKY